MLPPNFMQRRYLCTSLSTNRYKKTENAALPFDGGDFSVRVYSKRSFVFFGLQLQDYFVYPPDETLPPSASLSARVKYLLLLFIAFIIQFLFIISQLFTSVNRILTNIFLFLKKKCVSYLNCIGKSCIMIKSGLCPFIYCSL